VARLAIRAGYQVSVAHSGDPEDIALITEVVIPGAQPRWAADAAAEAGIVVLAMPLHRFSDLDPRILDGKLVVDAMNYWPLMTETWRFSRTVEPARSWPDASLARPRSRRLITSATTNLRTVGGRRARQADWLSSRGRRPQRSRRGR